MDDAVARPDADLLAVSRDFSLLVSVVAALTDDQAREPSLLPGWTRGHVLTHLARSGDGDTRTVEGAIRDEVVDKYPEGSEGRERDIDAGAGRPVAELLDDLAAAQGRLHAAWAAMPDDAWGRWARTPPGPRTAAQGVRTRRREILVHLVDLDLGFGPADLPADYLAFDAEFVHESRTRSTWPDAPWP